MEQRILVLFNQYGLGTPQRVLPLGGNKSLNYRVDTSHGSVVVRVVRKDKSPADLNIELGLLAYLRDFGYPAPEVVLTHNGRTTVTSGEHTAVLTHFVEGTHAHAPWAARQAGAALRTYHDLVPGFVTDTPMPHGESLTQILRERADKADTIAADGRVFVDTLAAAVESALAGTDELLLHGAPRTSSYLFHDNTLAAVLDFDSARMGYAAHDLGLALNSFGRLSRQREPAWETARALIEGYRPASPCLVRNAVLVTAALAVKRALSTRGLDADARTVWFASAQRTFQQLDTFVERLG